MPTESDIQKPTCLAELPHLPVEAIQAELEKILASSEFQGSAMLRQVLRFVVEKTLAGNPQEIKGYTIATQVLGRAGRILTAARTPLFEFWEADSARLWTTTT